MTNLLTLALGLLVLLPSDPAAAAQVRGEGRIRGTVVDEAGQPVGDVAIRATKKGETQALEAKTSAKGEFTLIQLATGEWTVEFSKPGFETQRGSVILDESGNVPRMDVKLAKTKADPNIELQAELKRADSLLRASQFAEARTIYEDLLAKHPSVFQLHRFIAAAYSGEKNFPKAVEHLDALLEKEPANVDVQVLKAEFLMMERDRQVEGVTLLQSIDLTQIKDPLPFINGGIILINEAKPDEAVAFLTKLAEQFPKQNEIYYYRGRAYLAAKKLPEAKADVEKFVSAAPPDAPQLAEARKILEGLKDVK